MQVGDFIAIIAEADSPIILRECGDGSHTMIGPAYVGLLGEAPCFQEGKMPELVQILIR